MAIVQCTNCGKKLKISDPKRLGTKARCPECQQVFILTAQSEEQPRQPAVNAPQQSKGPGKRAVAPAPPEPHLQTPPQMPPKAARATTSRSAPEPLVLKLPSKVSRKSCVEALSFWLCQLLPAAHTGCCSCGTRRPNSQRLLRRVQFPPHGE